MWVTRARSICASCAGHRQHTTGAPNARAFGDHNKGFSVVRGPRGASFGHVLAAAAAA